MHIKRFEAASLEEALAQVRAALGPDALILSTRTLKRGRSAFGLMARSVVEVQAARERGPSPERTTTVEASESIATGSSAGSAVSASDERDRVLRALVDELRGELSLSRRGEAFEEEIRSELRGLRTAFGKLLETRSGGETDRVAAGLVQTGLAGTHARSLVDEWQARRADGAETPIERILFDRLDARLVPPRVDPEKRIRILVGAPGSGKTTTLAKLAGRSEEGERDVSLVSLDPYRIGARDQLRAYAGLLDAPFSELSLPAELAEVARRHPSHAILVDTAGRSPGDGARLVSLDALRGVAERETSIELVIDATARREIAEAQLARFAPLRPDRLILTRLDECDSLAPVVNLLLDGRCPPLCWLGTGQRVPEDLEIAEPGLLTASVLGRAA